MIEKRNLFNEICRLGLNYQTFNKSLEKMYGLSLVQWYLLSHIKDAPGSTAKLLAKNIGVHPSTLTQSLKRLTKKAFIAVIEDTHDSRKKRIALTKNGFNVLLNFENSFSMTSVHMTENIQNLGRTSTEIVRLMKSQNIL